MSAYIIAEVEVTNPDTFEEYRRLVPRRSRHSEGATWHEGVPSGVWRATGNQAG